MRTFNNITLGISIALATTTLSFAAKNYLPDRDKPVPADQPVPTVDFVRPLLFENPGLSPDGKHFAAVTKSENMAPTLLVCEIATGKILWYRQGYSAFSWISNQHLRFSWSGSVIKISDPEHIAHIDTVLPRDKYGLMADSGVIKISDIRLEPSFNQSNINQRWHSPVDGELTYCVVSRDNGQRHLYRYEGRQWVECPVNLEEITPIEIGHQANEMLVLGPGGNGQTRAIQRMDVVTGKLGEIIYHDPKYDCLPSIMFKRGTWEIIGVRVAKSADRDVWFNETERAIQKLIDQQFKGSLAKIVSADILESKFLIEVQSDRQPSVFYFLDWEKKSLGLLKNTAPWIDPARMNPTQIMSYKTRDGLMIEGFVTLPANASKEHPVPLVVLSHAGPWQYRGWWSWSEFAQFFSSHGYAYFVPNYRGTRGYDSRFAPEDRFAFQKMSNDVSDGISALAKTGLVDSKRVAAFGVGIGSYLALCGALENPDLYQCAIIYGGVFDWEKAFRKTDSMNWVELRWLEKRLQERDQHPLSPMERHKDIHLPVFFARNLYALDVTMESQAWSMFNKLKDNAHSVSFGDLNMYTNDEAYSEHVDRLDQVKKFLDENLKAK